MEAFAKAVRRAFSVLFAMVLEPMIREIEHRVSKSTVEVLPALIQAYRDDLLLIAHDDEEFVQLAGLVAAFLQRMGMDTAAAIRKVVLPPPPKKGVPSYGGLRGQNQKIHPKTGTVQEKCR